MPSETILIAGGGASAALLTAHFARLAPQHRIFVIDPSPTFGRGMAYSTRCPRHLLNVPAGRMAAYPEDPGHLVRWLAEQGHTAFNELSFLPRRLYGSYLEAIAGSHATHLRQRAIGARLDGDRVRLELACGGVLEGDRLILACGNAQPAPWPNLDPEAAAHCFGLAWEPGALNPRAADDAILLLGSGLTAVDAALALRHHGHRGPLHMISRRGLLPTSHTRTPSPGTVTGEAATARQLLRLVRTAAEQAEARAAAGASGSWRNAVDSLRPRTNAIWQSLSPAEQRRFRRHLQPYWDVHRHRMAPQVAEAIETLRAKGTLHVEAGRILSITAQDNHAVVTMRRRCSAELIRLHAHRVINCTGPECDLTRIPNPLLRNLLAQKLLTPHILRAGARVDANGALINATGDASDRLFAIGPLRQGTLLETLAIPELRQQAQQLAIHLRDCAAGASTANPRRAVGAR